MASTGYVNKVGEEVPATVTDAVLVQSESLEDRPEHPPVRGVDWDNGQPTLDAMMAAFMTTGFQATEVSAPLKELHRRRRRRRHHHRFAAPRLAAIHRLTRK